MSDDSRQRKLRHDLIGVLALLKTVARRLPRNGTSPEIWGIFDAALAQLNDIISRERMPAPLATK